MTLPLGKTYPAKLGPTGKWQIDLSECPPHPSQVEQKPDEERATPNEADDAEGAEHGRD